MERSLRFGWRKPLASSVFQRIASPVRRHKISSFWRNVRTSGMRSSPNSLPHSPGATSRNCSSDLIRAKAISARSGKMPAIP